MAVTGFALLRNQYRTRLTVRLAARLQRDKPPAKNRGLFFFGSAGFDFGKPSNCHAEFISVYFGPFAGFGHVVGSYLNELPHSRSLDDVYPDENRG
jgi:hypothetical protein